MLDIAIRIEGQQGLTWDRWRRLASAVEALGFSGLYRSDHFTDPMPPERDSLELVVSLAWLADRTERIQFGPCVAPVSFRDPIMFTRQALQLAELSGGRMVLGLGAGWQEREHRMFGYPLGDVATRMARFGEALAVTNALVRGAGPAQFAGEFYHLDDAVLLPRSPGVTLPIMIGGNGLRRTLGLAARYADIWNGVWLTAGQFAERSAALDGMLAAAGRPADAVRRTLMTGIYFGVDHAGLARRLAWRSADAAPLDEQVATLRAAGQVIVGGPADCCEQLASMAAAGVQEIYLQWLDLDDLRGLEELAHHVLGRVG